MVTHLGTNRARPRVTSLMRPTPLPLRQTSIDDDDDDDDGGGLCQQRQVRRQAFTSSPSRRHRSD